jgi:hypothetical protein
MQSSKGRSVRTSGAVIAAVAILSFAVARVVVPSHEARADAAEPPVPVLVELFTSEGCSSCPSAEDELSRLEAEQPIPGVKVIGVALHVDYWNDLGWADPFSSSKWSDRQHEYDRSRGGRLYTPQAIVQGGRDCVGSDDGTLRSLLRYAGGAPQARVDVTLAAGAPAAVRVSVHVQGLPPVTSGDVAEVRVMLVERGITIDVPRGENSGKHLRHAPVLRDLASAGVLTSGAGTFDASLAVPPSGRRENMSVVALVQERASGRVLGVGTLAP